MLTTDYLLIVVAWLLSAILAAVVGASRGRAEAGALAGLLLGVLGVVVVLLIDSGEEAAKRQAWLANIGKKPPTT